MTYANQLMIGLALFGITATANAGHERDRDRDSHRGNGEVLARSAELARATHELVDVAERRLRHPNRSERNALKALRQLDKRAREFAREIERHGVNCSEHVARDYRRLMDARHEASEQSCQLQDYHRLYHRLQRVERLSAELSRDYRYALRGTTGPVRYADRREDEYPSRSRARVERDRIRTPWGYVRYRAHAW